MNEKTVLVPKFENRVSEDVKYSLAARECYNTDDKQNISGHKKNRYSSNNVLAKNSRLQSERDISVSKDYMHLFIMPLEMKKYASKHCYEVYDHGKMDIGIAQSIIGYVDRKIDKYKGLLISWFGGEPLLALEIVEYLSDSFISICEQHGKKYMAEMVTNGYLLSVSLLKKLYMHNIYSYGIVIDEEDPLCEKQRELVNGGEVYAVVLGNLIDIKEFVRKEHLEITIQIQISKKSLDSATELYIDQFKKQFEDEKSYDISMLVSWKNEHKRRQGNDEKRDMNHHSYFEENNVVLKSKSRVPSSRFRETLAIDEWEQSYRKRDLIIGFDGKLYKFANESGDDKNQIGYIAYDGTFNWNRSKKERKTRK